MKYYTIPEAAELLHCSVTTIRRRIYAGELKTKKNGKVYLISQDAINELINVENIGKPENYVSPIQRIETIIKFLENDILEQEKSIDKVEEILNFLDIDELLNITSDIPPIDEDNSVNDIVQSAHNMIRERKLSLSMLKATDSLAIVSLNILLDILKENKRNAE